MWVVADRSGRGEEGRVGVGEGGAGCVRGGRGTRSQCATSAVCCAQPPHGVCKQEVVKQREVGKALPEPQCWAQNKLACALCRLGRVPPAPTTAAAASTRTCTSVGAAAAVRAGVRRGREDQQVRLGQRKHGLDISCGGRGHRQIRPVLRPGTDSTDLVEPRGGVMQALLERWHKWRCRCRC